MLHNFVRMSTSAVNRICEGVSDKLLDSKVSDIHLAEIASDLVDWELLAPGISLTESDSKEIKEDFEGRYNLQKRQALRVWRWKNGDKATYRQLISICCSQGLISLAEIIARDCAGSRKRPRSSMLLDSTFYQYLLDCYRYLLHPSREQWPTKHVTVTPSTFFDLVLYEAPLNEISCSSLSSAPSSEIFKSVTLSNILRKEGDRLLVYFEGLAGSGKTTLSWHISREWAEKRLLEQFQLLIYVQMSNPKVQSAIRFPDIIPYPDKTLQQQIATAIIDQQGEGVCFLLDGLDEAPTSLLDLLVDELIKGRPGGWRLPKASFMMTSRPDNYVTSKLTSVLSSRIIIEGFSGDNLDRFLDVSLGSTSEKEMLVNKFKINPRLQGLCCHPINAVIMCFLSLFMKEKLPTTQTNLYTPLICNFLKRHMDTRISDEQSYDIIDNLIDDFCIPPQIRKPFRTLCSLAYSSVLKSKHLFTVEEIGQAKVDTTLGLLQVHPKITMYGSERYYGFSHLSIQEFLAAVYLSKKNENAQSTAIDEILNKNPRSQVLHFYAGLTRLSNRQALKLLSQSLSQSADLETIRRVSPHSDDPHSWPSAKALTFLNCLYESQNKNVFNLPETCLCSNPRLREEINKLQMQTKGNLFREDGPMGGTLTFAYLPLTPIDCLSIGYYARVNSLISRPSVPLQCYYLNRCSIDHIGISVLFTELKKDICQCTPGRVGLSLTGNTLHHVSLPLLKDLLQGQSNLETLMLSRCFLPADLHCALKYLTEGLSKNSSCMYIALSANYLSTSHVHHLILMLRANPQLCSLDLSCQDLRREMHLLWKAIQLLPNLQNLNMNSCNIHDPELALLQKVVKSHHKLSDLSIYCNHFTDRGLDNLLEVLKCNHTSSLSRLGLGVQLNEAEEVILREINEFRAANGHRLLTPTGFGDAKLAKEYESSLNEWHTR